MRRPSTHFIGLILLAAGIVAVNSYMVLGQNRSGLTNVSRQTVVIHLSSGPDDVFAATLALRMAEEAMYEKKDVILYLDKRGVRLAQHERTDQLRLGDEDPLWFLLDNLAERGLEVIVCGESAYIQGLFPRDFMHYTFIADSPGTILSRIDRSTVVFNF